MEAYFPSTPYAGKLVHLGVCGSIAAYKALDFLRACNKSGLRVSATLTASAAKFVTPLSFRSLGAEQVYGSLFSAASDAFEKEDFDPFSHLTPGAEADSFVILPASATSIARLANGMADEMLSAQALAYTRPLVIAPAMNPRMWAAPATHDNTAKLAQRGHIIIEPAGGVVACKETGQGKLADLRLAYLAMLKQLSPQDMAGKKIMLTVGPTREAWDGVRYWTNPSTGLMGASFAICAMLRGAVVYAVCGPSVPWLPSGINRINVTSATEMFAAAKSLWSDMDAGIFTAAVADYSPMPFGAEKFKKDSTPAADLNIKFIPNADILATIGKEKKPEQKIVGFAAETGNIEDNARAKLKRKNADILVGNFVGGENSAFGNQNNTVFVTDKNGKEETWNPLPKPDVAWRVLDWLLTL